MKEMEDELVKKLYTENFELKTKDGKNFEVPVSGSLGLLAIGYKGIIAWRKKKFNDFKTSSEFKKKK